MRSPIFGTAVGDAIVFSPISVKLLKTGTDLQDLIIFITSDSIFDPEIDGNIP